MRVCGLRQRCDLADVELVLAADCFAVVLVEDALDHVDLLRELPDNQTCETWNLASGFDLFGVRLVEADGALVVHA